MSSLYDMHVSWGRCRVMGRGSDSLYSAPFSRVGAQICVPDDDSIFLSTSFPMLCIAPFDFCQFPPLICHVFSDPHRLELVQWVLVIWGFNTCRFGADRGHRIKNTIVIILLRCNFFMPNVLHPCHTWLCCLLLCIAAALLKGPTICRLK